MDEWMKPGNQQQQQITQNRQKRKKKEKIADALPRGGGHFNRFNKNNNSILWGGVGISGCVFYFLTLCF
jgi:hypothetical protein